jgi:glycosyltransferase involved in cell wall biosynthesis
MNEMTNPLVSVIIPVYNCEQYIAESIESVLNQTYHPIQTIVVDDGSVDGSAEIAQAYKDVTYIYQENQGHGAAKNTGIAASSGEFIGFNDSDDIFVREKVHRQAKLLMDNPDFGYVICDVLNFLEPGLEHPKFMINEEYNSIVPDYMGGSMLIRRTTFNKVGVFNPSLKIANDSDWIIRAKDAGVKMGVLNEVLLKRRIHGSNQTFYRPYGSQSAKELMKLVRASVHRQND